MIICQDIPEFGLMRVSGETPNGNAVIIRQVAGQQDYPLRGGISAITTGGFSLDDTEAPLGVPLTYRASISGISTADRIIQQNLMLTPTFMHGAQGWVAGVNRVLSLVGESTSHSPTVGKFGKNLTGIGLPGDATQRIVAKAKTAALPAAADPYLFTGRLKFTTLDLNLWSDIKAIGTWQQVKTAKATWQQVLGTASSSPATFLTLTVAIVNPSGGANYITPVQVITPAGTAVNTWVDFSFLFTVGTSIPATAEIQLSHGTTTAEYGVEWYFDEFGITPGTQRLHDTVYWFDGDSAIPAVPGPIDYLYPGEGWVATSADAAMSWTGTVGNSVSLFIGPSAVTTTTVCQLNPPAVISGAIAGMPCEPVYLSDPVAATLGIWAGLMAVDSLTHPAKQRIHQIINRAPAVAISQVRGWETGSLTLLTKTLADRDQMLAVFRSGRVLFIRNLNTAYPENNWYLACGDLIEDRPIPDARQPERSWKFSYVRVERPTGLIEASGGVSWQQVKDVGSWADLKALRHDWLDVLVGQTVD